MEQLIASERGCGGAAFADGGEQAEQRLDASQELRGARRAFRPEPGPHSRGLTCSGAAQQAQSSAACEQQTGRRLQRLPRLGLWEVCVWAVGRRRRLAMRTPACVLDRRRAPHLLCRRNKVAEAEGPSLEDDLGEQPVRRAQS